MLPPSGSTSGSAASATGRARRLMGTTPLALPLMAPLAPLAGEPRVTSDACTSLAGGTRLGFTQAVPSPFQRRCARDAAQRRQSPGAPGRRPRRRRARGCAAPRRAAAFALRSAIPTPPQTARAAFAAPQPRRPRADARPRRRAPAPPEASHSGAPSGSDYLTDGESYTESYVSGEVSEAPPPPPPAPKPARRGVFACFKRKPKETPVEEAEDEAPPDGACLRAHALGRGAQPP